MWQALSATFQYISSAAGLPAALLFVMCGTLFVLWWLERKDRLHAQQIAEDRHTRMLAMYERSIEVTSTLAVVLAEIKGRLA